MSYFYIDNDHNVRVENLRYDNGTPITNATVSATLYFRDGESEVGGVVWPIGLTGDGNGNYTGHLPAAANVYLGSQTVVLKITAKTVLNETATWYKELAVAWR